VKFKTVADSFAQIEVISSRLEITQLLATLLKQATSHEASFICYLSLGELNPPHIGTQFNLAEKNLIKVVARVVGNADETVKSNLKKVGDLGSILYEHEYEGSKELTVTQVYEALCHLEAIGGTGSQKEKLDYLYDLLLQLDPLSAKYVVRIVTGKLRLGFSDMTIIDALSWMEAGDKSLRKKIENAYNMCADIGLIASVLKEDGMETIEKMVARVGIPIRPSAAERLPTAKAIFEKIGHCVAQPKLDGFRLQIHMDKTKKEPTIHFFSRNLLDMSGMFPDLKEAFANVAVETIICEGEAISFDTNTGSFLPFQETVKRRRKHGIDQAAQEFPLQVFLFDLLYLNGKMLLDESHATRRKKLLGVLKGFKNKTVQVIEEQEISSAKQLEEYFVSNIASGLEGLVVKKEDSIYQPGKRNFNWIKLKRQEEGHLEDTLDCVILGYYAGKGKRAGFGIGAFLVGLYNKREDAFQTVAKIGTGLKDEGWKELKKKCDAVAVTNKPRNVNCPKELYPDVWTAPELVCMIRADEITMSPLHTAGRVEKELGLALRFPRFMGYRPDKSPEQSTTIKELKTLYKHQFGKN